MDVDVRIADVTDVGAADITDVRAADVTDAGTADVTDAEDNDEELKEDEPPRAKKAKTAAGQYLIVTLKKTLVLEAKAAALWNCVCNDFLLPFMYTCNYAP